jgi:hypothetical protein
MRFALFGFWFAAVIFLIISGHMLFLPLIFLPALGGLFGPRHHKVRVGR